MSDPPLPPPASRTLDFEEVLGVLFSWQGSTVHASADAFSDPPLMPVWALGRLGMDPRRIADPFDSDEFEFTIGDPQPQPHGGDRYPGGFSIHRRFFDGGALLSDDRLIIELREHDDDGLYEQALGARRDRRLVSAAGRRPMVTRCCARYPPCPRDRQTVCVRSVR